MADKSDIYTLRGSIAHRAVLWPFTRPCVGSWLDHYRHPRALQAEAESNLDVLQTAISAAWRTGLIRDYRAAEAMLNLNGPADDKANLERTSRSFTSAEQKEALSGLPMLVRNGANAVEAWVKTRGLHGDDFVSVWSEAPLRSIRGFHAEDEGSIGWQADLVGVRQSGDLEVIDLKFGTMKPQEWVVERAETQLSGYVDAAKRYLAAEGSRVSGKIVFIGRSPSSRVASTCHVHNLK